MVIGGTTQSTITTAVCATTTFGSTEPFGACCTPQCQNGPGSLALCSCTGYSDAAVTCSGSQPLAGCCAKAALGESQGINPAPDPSTPVTTSAPTVAPTVAPTLPPSPVATTGPPVVPPSSTSSQSPPPSSQNQPVAPPGAPSSSSGELKCLRIRLGFLRLEVSWTGRLLVGCSSTRSACIERSYLVRLLCCKPTNDPSKLHMIR